ncbi:unnamed protein product [Tetraodon nigroviridis]|uniref:(spotted green pufferfish) hypothetical protein n=1 Tax=Tetraodon nigroviridis TaxID=99883 RepID=Q4SLD0_TETNG|nr:unnamed protein product [Tetraodon nigroviridis]
MSWMFSIWAAGALLTVCGGENTVPAVHKVPFSVTRPCGGWLLWKTCTVTEYRLSHQTEYRTVSEQETSCCHGYVQVGRYCAPGSTTHFEQGRNRFNATVIVKTDYDELVSQDGGLLNHTRLLHAMVTGALRQNVSIRYMDSWPVDPYRTATALLLSCPFDLHNVTSKLLLLLKHIEEVSSVTVEAGSTWAYTDPPLAFSPTTNTNSSASSTVSYPQGNNSTDNSGSTAPTPAVISSLWSANVTGTSFCVYWSSRAQTSQVYRVVVEKGAETLHVWETPENTMAVPGLGPGVLYTVTVTPRGCGQPVHVAVRTDAVTLGATARITNVQFTAELQDASSRAYRNLTESILAEGAISVQCRGAAITVSVARDFLLSASIGENSLYLGLQGCGVNGGSSTHTQLTVGWSECDTRLVHNESHYMASVTLFNTVDQNVLPSGVTETPKIHLEVPIMCAYEKSMLISADFGSTGYELFKDVIVGSGSFLVSVKLTNGTAPLPHNHSLSSDEVVVVDVSLNTTLDQMKVVINRCWATPTQNPGDTYSYAFMENSCSLNAYTKVLTNGNSSTSRVSVQIFSFVDLSVIYLHCQRNRIGHYNFNANPKQENFTFSGVNSTGVKSRDISGPVQ